MIMRTNCLHDRYFTNQKNICDFSKLTSVLTVVVEIALVVTECVVGGVVVVVVVLETAGFHILNCQNVGSVMGADSASFMLQRV